MQRLLALVLCGFLPTLASAGETPASRVVSVRKIWDRGEYQMTTDLLRHQGRWLCTFRESDEHVPGLDGKIRIIASNDGTAWESVAFLAEAGVDLRDPKLSVMPDGRLMLLLSGSLYRGPAVPKKERKLLSTQTRVAFSQDGQHWSAFQGVLPKDEWLWRVTWHKGRAYGVSYTCFPSRDGLAARLYATADGLHYDLLATFDDPGELDEATVRFLPDGTMIMLARRELADKKAWIGQSKPPYKEWAWYKTAHEVGGPDFIILPDGRMFGGGRRDVARDPRDNRVVFARMARDAYQPVLDFPGGKDCGYPAFAWHDGLVWMTYYSAAGGDKGNIYLARIKIDPD